MSYYNNQALLNLNFSHEMSTAKNLLKYLPSVEYSGTNVACLSFFVKKKIEWAFPASHEIWTFCAENSLQCAKITNDLRLREYKGTCPSEVKFNKNIHILSSSSYKDGDIENRNLSCKGKELDQQ